MKTCKFCGKEIKETEFSSMFTDEALENMPCSQECKEKMLERESKVIDIDTIRHPDHYGPYKEED